jgi:uncharacterized membrane protein YqiK
MLREKAAQEAAELAKSEAEAQARAQQALCETTQVRSNSLLLNLCITVQTRQE